MAKTKKIVRREWTKDDVRQMKAMAKAKAGVKNDFSDAQKNPGRYLRNGGQAWRVAIDAILG